MQRISAFVLGHCHCTSLLPLPAIPFAQGSYLCINYCLKPSAVALLIPLSALANQHAAYEPSLSLFRSLSAALISVSFIASRAQLPSMHIVADPHRIYMRQPVDEGTPAPAKEYCLQPCRTKNVVADQIFFSNLFKSFNQGRNHA